MSDLPPKSYLSHVPPAYLRFVERGREIAIANGLLWHIPFNENGKVKTRDSWDLRQLCKNHERHASRIISFEIDHEVRTCMMAEGTPEMQLPSGRILGHEAQDFLKSYAIHRGTAGVLPRSVRAELKVLRRFFSSTNRLPWQLNTEDLDRYVASSPYGARDESAISVLAKFINEKMLSVSVPLVPKSIKKTTAKLGTMLAERKNQQKLPSIDALHEMVRIVFWEEPKGHQHKIRFAISKLLTLTGLRLNEVIMLPADCLQWVEHVDVVTGQPAGDVGGISRSLTLKYFAEKSQKLRDKVLVESYKGVPAKFEKLVADTVSTILSETQPLRAALQKCQQSGRRFRTDSGEEFGLENFLFLVIVGGRGELPASIPGNAVIETPAQSSFLQFIGAVNKTGKPTMFSIYSNLPNKTQLSIKSHSLRHLMNGELFRAGVPDTVITQHFGRQSVAQSYEYNHDSLGERLNAIALPTSAYAHISQGTPAETVAKIILSDAVNLSTIATTFKGIQQKHGDEAGFKYLAENSDGFHMTPYGFCITSFAVNPCVRHLKCFDNCRNYLPSGQTEHIVALQSLRQSLHTLREKASSQPALSMGRKNQIAHADQLLKGVETALASQPSQPLFPTGNDYSLPIRDLFK